MKKITTLVYFVLLFSLTVTSCNQCGTKKADKSKLRIGYIPILDCSQLYIAQETKIFEKNNLEVELIPIEGGAKILEALASDKVDIAFSNLVSVVFYQKNFADLKNISGGTLMNKEYTEGGLIVLNNSNIAKIDDFKGKTIAVNALNNIVHLSVLRILRQNGISPKDVKFVEMKFSDMSLALRAKRIDIAAIPEPLLTMVKKEGGIRDFGDYIVMAFGEIYVTSYFTSSTKYNAFKESIDKYNKSIAEATSILNSQDTVAYAAISKYTKIDTKIVRECGKPLFVEKISDSAILKMKEYLNEESLIK